MKEILKEFEIGIRLDKALSLAYPQYSRSVLEKLILSGSVLVNGIQVVTKYKTKPGDKIEIDLSIFTNPTPEIDLPVIFEDKDVVVINKPTGVLTHAKGTLHNEATVATWLQAHTAKSDLANQLWESNRAGIVHRLDRGTSGVMICAKNQSAQTFLQKQFEKRNVKKTYIAIISNELPEKEGLIDVPIERNPKKPATFRPGNNGKSAQTEFRTLSTSHISRSGKDTSYSLIELNPHTGRTHQLRVHLAYLHSPIVGDELYGGEKAERLMLHARNLEITLPSSERRTFEADLPSEFESYET